MIKRYELSGYSSIDMSARVDAFESESGGWCRYADIAPLEAKAAMFDEAIDALKGVKEILNSDAVIGIFACAANHHCVYTGPTTDKLIEPLLTRARAMESAK